MNHLREYPSHAEAKANVGPGEALFYWGPTGQWAVVPVELWGEPFGEIAERYLWTIHREAQAEVVVSA